MQIGASDEVVSVVPSLPSSIPRKASNSEIQKATKHLRSKFLFSVRHQAPTGLQRLVPTMLDGTQSSVEKEQSRCRHGGKAREKA